MTSSTQVENNCIYALHYLCGIKFFKKGIWCQESKYFYLLRLTRKAKAAFGRLSLEQGYNQTCHYYQNLQADIPKLHAKFHQNLWCGFGEKWDQDNDIL